MKMNLWKKRIALMICCLMVFTSIPTASFALAAQESTSAGETTEAADQNKEKETTEEKAADTEKTTTDSSEVKNTNSKEASSETELPKRKAVRFSANFAAKATGEMTTLKKTFKNPASGISKAVIALQSKKDGYKKGDTDLGVTFDVDLTLDEDYLYAGNDAHMSDAGYPQFDGDNYDQYMDAVDKFLEALPADSLEPIVYTYDLGEDFTVPDDKKITKDLTIASTNEKLGTLVAEKLNGRCIVTITFENKVYNRSGVAAGMDVDLEIDKKALKDDKPVFAQWEDDAIIVDVKGASGPDEPAAAGTKDYTVEKTAKEKVDTPYIDYEIKVNTKATGKNLEGLILEDAIPEGMEIVSVKKGDVELKADSQYSENTYKLAKGKLTYQFQKSGSSEETVTFQVRLALTKDEYVTKVEKGKGTVNEKIENTARLYSQDSKKEVADASTAATDMKFSVMSKNGKPEGMDGTRYAWTLDVNTKFSELTQAYIADVICFDDHRFEAGEGKISVYIDGKYDSRLDIEEKTLSDPPAYDELKNGMYKSVVGDAKAPFYYTYKGKGADEDPSKTYAVLIIPFVGDYQNNKVQFKYYTNVWLGEKDGNPITVDQWLKENKDGNTEKKVTNDVKLLWDRFKYGTGPDIFEWNVELTKTYDAAAKIGYKAAGSYDETKQLLKWKFIVNNYGAKLEGTTITDKLDPNKYDLDSIQLSYDQYGRKPMKQKAFNEPIKEDGTGIHYSLANDGNLVVTIPQTIEEADDYYEVTLQIKVTDEKVLSQQGTKEGFDNKATFKATVGGTPVTNTYTAKKDLTNTLITKKAVGKYDYANRELAWQVGVDPNHIALTDLVVTDELPDKNQFGQLKAVTRIDKDGNEYKNDANISQNDETITLDNGVQITLTIDKTNADKQKAVFTFGGNGTGDYQQDSYIFDFTTKITDESYLTQMFKGSDDVKMTNKATLSGKYQGTEITGSANAEAVHVIKNGIIKKNGTYAADEGKIAWSITFNQNKVDISGMTLIEEIGGQPLEIDDTTLSLHTIGADGSENKDNLFEPTNYKPIANDGGFSYTIPDQDEIKCKTLVLKFETYLTETAEASEIQNKAKLMKQDEIYQESASSNGGYDGSFDMDKYVIATKKPILQVIKTSSTDDDPNTGRLPLTGVEFNATAYKPSSGTSTSYVKDPNYSRTGVTNKLGRINFVNLKTDYVYKLEEVEVPAGYTDKVNPEYYLFTTKDSTLGNNEDGTETFTVGGEDVTVKIFKSQQDGTYETNDTIHTFKNTPTDTMKISFTKQDKGGNPFNDTTKAVFVLQDKGGCLAPREAETGNDGKVTFEKVDPGQYTLTEKTSSDPYDQGAVFDVTMEPGKPGEPGKYTITHKEGNAAITGDQGSYVIQNEYAKGTIKLKKTGSDSAHISLKGAVFQLFDESGAEIKNKDGKAITATTNNDGIATFNNVSAEQGYVIKETTPPDGYSTDGLPKEIKKITKDEIAAKLQGEPGKAKSFTFDFTKEQNDRIENERTKGSITLTKVNSTGNPLSGRTFQLFYADEDGYNRWKKGDEAAKEQTTDAETDADGNLTFTDIPYGNYTLKEITPEGDIYKTYSKAFSLREKIKKDLDTRRKDANPDNDNTFSIDLEEITNNLLTAEFSIKKQDATTKEVLPGVTFILTGYDAEGNEVNKEMQTGPAGTAEWTGIPIGEDKGATPYVLKEKTPPDGYNTPAEYNVYVKPAEEEVDHAVVTIFERKADDSDGEEIKLTQSENNYVIENHPLTASLQFTKTDEDGKNKLEGAEFKLYRVIDGKPVEGTEWSPDNPQGYHTATSTHGGLVNFEQVEYGDYQLEEITPPEGYKPWTGRMTINKGDLTLSPGETKFEFKGSKNSNITNEKIDLQFLKKDQFGKAVEGAKMQLTGIFAGKSGEQTIKWTSGEKAYDLTASLIAGNTYTLSESAVPSSGLYKKAADVTFKVGDDGKLTEIEPKDSAAYSYDADAGTLTLIDARYLAHVELVKEDQAKHRLQGVTFSLYQQLGEKPAAGDDILIAENLTTGADGTWKSSDAPDTMENQITAGKLKDGLGNGTYYFKETAALDGYVLDETPKTFTITAEKDATTVTKKIENQRSTIAFTKMGKYIEACSDEKLGALSPDSLRPVAGAQFAISKEETPDTIIETVSSDAEGKVTSTKKLSPGNYLIKETKAPEGYLKDDTVYTAQIS